MMLYFLKMGNKTLENIPLELISASKYMLGIIFEKN